MQDPTPSPPEVAAQESPFAEALVAGDREAFEAFYAFFFPRVWRFALRHSADAVSAERLTEAVLAAVVTALPEHGCGEQIARLVFDTARRLARSSDTDVAFP
jgi:DNA-directed RNA polymerase specialized sigma24 family protein